MVSHLSGSLSSEGYHGLYYRVSKAEGLLKSGHRSPQMPFLLHFISETEHKANPDTKSENIHYTSQWEEWQAQTKWKYYWQPCL